MKMFKKKYINHNTRKQSQVIIEAYKGTRRIHHMKFRQIGHITSQYGQSFFSKTINAWNGFVFVETPSLAVFRSNFI